MTRFQIRTHTSMHQDDVEQLSQHDLARLNFHAVEAEPTTDFIRTLDENRLEEALDEQRFGTLYINQMNIPEYMRRLVVKHDSDGHTTREDERWSAILNDRHENPVVKMTNAGFPDATHWMDKVPSFSSHQSVWHFHPLEFL